MTFTEHIDKKNEEYDCGIFAPPTTDREALKLICDYLLGGDWVTTDPVSHEQVNTERVHDILYKYSKKYRKEYKKWTSERRNRR